MAIDDKLQEFRDGLAEIIDQVTNLRSGKRGGRLYAELFMVEPDADEYPAYYQVIKSPMAFETIKSKIGSGKYRTIEQFKDDTILIFKNATIFNEEGSQVYNDALHLQKAFESRLDNKRADLEELEKAVAGHDAETKTNRKRKHAPDEEVPSRSVKLKISLKEPEELKPKIKLNLGIRNKREKEEKPEPATQEQAKPEEKEERQPEPEQQVLEKPSVPSPSLQGPVQGSVNVNTEIKVNSISVPEPDVLPSAVPLKPPEMVIIKRGRGRPRTRPLPGTGFVPTPRKDDFLTGKLEDIGSPRSTRSVRQSGEPLGYVTGGTPSLLGRTVDDLKSELGVQTIVPANSANQGQSPNTAAKIPEEIRTRAPGKTIADALITHFTISSNTRQIHAPPYRIVFPPNAKETFQSYSIILPAIYNSITISPTLSASLLMRQYNLYMSLNSRRLSPTIMPGLGTRRPAEPPKSLYDVKLNPGINQIECLVHASPPQMPSNFGTARLVPPPTRYTPIGTQPQSVNPEGSEKEKFVIWIFLQRAYV
ncbi:hypothetical protein V1514DRAFT_333563 [Lipomyces japonicus]|uniref:uncharacterized protein n=1 Tax=Lipomyces japonicus TaxID=56871 RepID=UPI0034CF9BAD